MSTIGSLTEFKLESERIEAYLERVQLCFDANGIEDEKKVAVLLTVIGSTTYALLSSLLAPRKPREKSFEELAATLRRHFEPKPLVIAERFHFHRRNQASGENISDYVAELRRLATNCEFGDYLEQALRDRFACGIRHENTQKRLLTEANLTLTKAIETARNIEVAEVQASQLKATSSIPVMNVKSSKKSQGRDTGEKHGMCTRCGGRSHKAKDCCYRDVRCHKCNKPGHLARMCRSKQPSTSTPPGRQRSQQTNYIEGTPHSNSDDSNFQIHSKPSRPFTVDMCIQGTTLTFEVDTGAAVTLISEETYRKHFLSKSLQKTSVRLKTYTDNQVHVLGQITVDVSYGTQKGMYTLFVVKGSGTNLLGRDWMRHIRLDWKSIASTVNNVSSPCYQPLLDKYSEVFKDELGTLKFMKVQLQVHSQVTPKFCKPRPVPFALKEALERELLRLQQLGILQKVNHSAWAAPVVVVPKGDGCIRVCGDYKVTVNPVLVVDKYPLPKPDDLMAQLAGGQKFSKLDLSQAYQQILLDDDSRKFVTINTHLGLFQYTSTGKH